MKKGLLKVNFESVKSYSANLNSVSNEVTNSYKAPSGMQIVTQGLVPTYFDKLNQFVEKHGNYIMELSKAIDVYHGELTAIEGYSTQETAQEPASEEPVVGGGSPHGGNHNPSFEPELTEIEVSPGIEVNLDFGSLPINASMDQIMGIIAAYIAQFGLTLPDLFSGNYEHLLSQIIGYSPNTPTLLAILTQLNELLMQAYLKGMMNNPGAPQMFQPIKSFLRYFAQFLDVDLNKLMIDPQYALAIKMALQDHRTSLINLNNINQETALEVQSKLNDMIYGDGKGNYNKHGVDDVTINMLKDYLASVAKKNNISLESLLGEEKYANIAKTALDEFLKFALLGKTEGLAFAGIPEDAENLGPEEEEKVVIPDSEFKESGYSVLSADANTDQVNSTLDALLEKYGLTLEELYSGEHNDVLNQVLNNASHTTTFIVTANQLDDLNLQAYLNGLNNGDSVPKHFVSVESYLSYLAKTEGVSVEELLTDPKYSALVKDSLYQYRESLISLNNLSEKDSVSIQQSINQFLLSDDKSNYNIDGATDKMLEEYLRSVAEKNNISLEDMLTQEKYADLTKESLKEFMNFSLNGEESDLPVANIVEQITEIATENNTTPEQILNGENNEALTEVITSTENPAEVAEVINNVDENALQNYVNEIVNEGKHPEVNNNPVIKEVIRTIVVNKEYIKGNTNEIIIPEVEEPKLTEEPIVIEELPKEELKEILTNENYAPQIKEVVNKTNSFNWASLFPLAGLGLIPLIAVVRKKNKENPQRESYVFSDEETKPIVDSNFKYFAESNIVTEESLLDGSNSELLSIYLSQLESLSAVLNVLSIMKDQHLQKYLFELYNFKYEHVWSSKSLIIKILFNDLTNIAFKQGIEINTLLSNSNYVVWVKTSIVDIMKAYSKYEGDINSSGGFKLFLNSVLGKSILVNEANLNVLKMFFELNAKKANLDFDSFVNQLSEYDNKLIIFAIIRYGEGSKPYSFGFLDSLNDDSSNSSDGGFIPKETGKERIFDESGYNALLFNSSEELIEKALAAIAKNYNTSVKDLYTISNENIFTLLLNKSTNLILTLYLLLKLDSDRLQKYLHALYTKSTENKFLLIVLKYLEYLAKSENTTLNALLTKGEYAKLIIESLADFKKSVTSIISLAKKDGTTLNEEINDLFFMEDTSKYEIDKISIELIKGMLSSLGKAKNIGLNALLDIKNISLLKELMEKIVNTLLFIKETNNENSNEEKKLTPLNLRAMDEKKSSETKNNVDISKLVDGSNYDLLNKYFDETDDIFKIIDVLLSMDEIIMQKYLNELNKKSTKNKFLLYILKLLQNYALTEATTIEYVLSNAVYASKLKVLISEFSKSIKNFEALSKIDASELSKEMNTLMNIDDTSSYGIDKVTLNLIKELLTNSTKTDNLDLNSLSDPKNANVLKKLMQKIINDITTSLTFNTKKVDFSKNNFNKDEVVNALREAFGNSNYSNSPLLSKIKSYFEIMISESGISFEEYIFGQEFSNFIKINFENTNIMSFIYEYMESNIDYDFDVNKKIIDLAVKNNLKYDELRSKGGLSFVVQSILKENNIIYSLETLVTFEKDNISEALLELNSIKENTNINNLFDYIDKNLKKPSSLPIEEYINENKKTILLFLVKVLLMLLILLLLMNKEEKEVK